MPGGSVDSDRDSEGSIFCLALCYFPDIRSSVRADAYSMIHQQHILIAQSRSSNIVVERVLGVRVES